MSWQLASIGLIALVLAAGGVWYERSRPPARLVALVAALAALAVAGRVVLAPIPNVVATTDIALLTGYSLGAAPGFAVGALAGLISNIWLGQGPWTPWQMAGWGLVGLGGAALARLTLRRAGRASLAIAAGLAGLAYGALLDLSVMVNFGGEQSLDRYLALSARGVPFNVAHALGNIVLIWAAGPAIVRMLDRYRVRSIFVWHPPPPRTSRKARYPNPSGTFGVILALAVLALLPAAALAGPASKATDWLVEQQNADGGWGNSPGAESSPGMTTWVMLGIEAAGLNPHDVRSGAGNPVAYLRKRAGQVTSATDIERTILALEGAGVSSRNFAGRDLVAELLDERLRDGSWKGGVNPTAFGVLALTAAAAGEKTRRSLRWLDRAQNKDGGWGFNRGVPSDPDSTAAAMQALGARDGGGSAVRAGVKYLKRAQRGDGGFPAQPGLVSNSQSTAWAIQGFVVAGAGPGSIRKRQASPIDFLRRRQAGDGHVAYSRHSDQTPVWVTAQAVMGFEEVALPVSAPPRESRPAGGGGTGGAGGGRQAPAPAPTSAVGGPAGGAVAGAGGGLAGPAGKGKAKGDRDSDGKHERREQRRDGSKDDAEGPRADRVIVNADPSTADISEPKGDVGEDDGGPGALLIALLAAGFAALAAAAFWAYRRFIA